MTGQTTYKEIYTEKTKGKKRYLERIQQDKEAKEETLKALEELVQENQRLGLYEEWYEKG
jgi:hypothetical protein